MPLILRQNPLAFPNRAPGIDITNTPGTIFSAIAANKNLINLLNGNIGTPTSTNALWTPQGPTVDCPSNAKVLFTGQSTATITSFTCAAIVSFTSIVGAGENYIQGLLQTSTTSTGGVTGAQFLLGQYGVAGAAGKPSIGFYASTAFSSGILLSINIPYFLWASLINTSGTNYTANFVVLNLNTGQIRTATTSGTATAAAGNGTFQVANLAPGFWMGGTISAILFQTVGQSLQAGLAAAADPWSLWYPRSSLLASSVGAAAAAAATPFIFTPAIIP